jgi:hypothetical protein
LDVAIAMGASLEPQGWVPAFAAQAGIGDGPIGFQAGFRATQASGRSHGTTATNVVDRIGVDALVAFRPFARLVADRKGWYLRVARSFSLNLGIRIENDNAGQQAARRVGTAFGAELDFPLTPSTEAGELQLRVGMRRMVGPSAKAGNVTIGDSDLELFSGLAVKF